MSIDKSTIDFGILNPETTEVYGPDDGYHVLLRGQQGDWPYRPEVLQRRNNNFDASIIIPIRVRGADIQDIKHANHLEIGQELGPQYDFFDVCAALFERWPTEFKEKQKQLEVRLVRMRRPGAPDGLEWNAPGGVVRVSSESSVQAALREISEEVDELDVLAFSPLFWNTQFASGAYRESNTIFVALVAGAATINPDEGAVAKVWIPLATSIRETLAPIAPQPSTVTNCSGVDGKVVMGLQHVIDRLMENEAF